MIKLVKMPVSYQPKDFTLTKSDRDEMETKFLTHVKSVQEELDIALNNGYQVVSDLLVTIDNWTMIYYTLHKKPLAVPPPQDGNNGK